MAIQFLRGTKSTLASSNQIFLAGQPVFESDSGQLKIGDGVNSFSNLPYVGEGLSSGGGGSITAGTYHSVDSRTAYIDVTENYRIVIRRNLTTVDQEMVDEIKQWGSITLKSPDGTKDQMFYSSVAFNSYGAMPISTNSAIQSYLYSKIPFAEAKIGVWTGRYDFSDDTQQIVSRLSGDDFRTIPLTCIQQFDNEDPDVIERLNYEYLLYLNPSSLPAYFITTVIIHTFKS